MTKKIIFQEFNNNFINSHLQGNSSWEEKLISRIHYYYCYIMLLVSDHRHHFDQSRMCRELPCLCHCLPHWHRSLPARHDGSQHLVQQHPPLLFTASPAQPCKRSEVRCNSWSYPHAVQWLRGSPPRISHRDAYLSTPRHCAWHSIMHTLIRQPPQPLLWGSGSLLSGGGINREKTPALYPLHLAGTSNKEWPWSYDTPTPRATPGCYQAYVGMLYSLRPSNRTLANFYRIKEPKQDEPQPTSTGWKKIYTVYYPLNI